MPLNNIQLRRFLEFGFAPPRRRRSRLMSDIRSEQNKLAGRANGGGDFYAPFWADACAHVFGERDLTEATAGRIADNRRRRLLYPELRDGFMLWWTERRRWTNAPFERADPLRARFDVPGLAATIRVDSILSVRDGLGVEHYVYPYFSPIPALDDEAARIGLWLLGRALPDVPHHEIRILDVIRGQTFSIDRHALKGDEERRLALYHAGLVRDRAALAQAA